MQFRLQKGYKSKRISLSIEKIYSSCDEYIVCTFCVRLPLEMYFMDALQNFVTCCMEFFSVQSISKFVGNILKVCSKSKNNTKVHISVRKKVSIKGAALPKSAIRQYFFIFCIYVFFFHIL